jgi:hypothetical protein
LTGGNCGEFVSDEIIITHGGWAQVINALTQTSTTATFPTPSYSLTARSVTHWLGTNAAATPPIDKGYVGGTLQRYRWQWRAKYFAITDGQSRFYFTPLATDRITNANTQDMTMADISFSIPSLNDIVLPANIPSNARFAELEVVATPILTYPGCTQEFVGVGTSFTITQTPPKLLANHESSIGNVAVSTSIRAMTNNPFALQIQPNPASDLVTLSFVPPEKGTYTVEILDALQRRVFTLPQTLYHQELSAQSLNLASFSNGTYTVRIFGTTEHGTFYATAQPLIIIK